MYIQVSQDFKKKSKAAVVSIVFFIFTYILLFLAAIALTVLCVIGGISLVVAKPSIITGALGLGLASTGFFVLYFLIKFLFQKHLNDRSHLVEITRNQQPELFTMIDEIVRETETDFPKKVYLSADVNASVFYDSSFWSMFLPIKKNLTIGVGLVNTCTRQELKAILAHEFGHFSQRSMKVGSYVYNVNKVIFNLLNNDESLQNTMQSWASATGYFAIFVMIASKIIQGIQWILVKMYSFVNIRHMALSREMEFHADEVAANIAGSLPLEESLLRMDLADNAYSSVINFYNNHKISQKEISGNVYREQTFVMNFLANENELEYKNGLPDVKLSETGLFNKSKLVIENQWASHPSTEDRIKRLRTLNIQKQEDNRSAKTLFNNFDETEQKLTTKIFSTLEKVKDYQHTQISIFETEFTSDYRKNSFDKLYNAYYDNKNPVPFDVETTFANGNPPDFETLFSKTVVEEVYELNALENDKNMLESIAKKEINIKTFDYDGIKYSAKDAQKLVPKLSQQAEEIQKNIAAHDIQIYTYFLSICESLADKEKLKENYKQLFSYDQEYEEKYKHFIDMNTSLAFVNTTTPFDQIKQNFRKLQPKEDLMKKELKFFLNSPMLKQEMDADVRKDLENYVHSTPIYFNNNEYFETNLQTLFFAINCYQFYLGRYYFLLKKRLLNVQVDLYNKSKSHGINPNFRKEKSGFSNNTENENGQHSAFSGLN